MSFGQTKVRGKRCGVVFFSNIEVKDFMNRWKEKYLSCKIFEVKQQLFLPCICRMFLTYLKLISSVFKRTKHTNVPFSLSPTTHCQRENKVRAIGRVITIRHVISLRRGTHGKGSPSSIFSLNFIKLQDLGLTNHHPSQENGLNTIIEKFPSIQCVTVSIWW